MELNKGQQEAYNEIMNGANVFLTGEAGTGKSFVTKKVIDAFDTEGKNVVVCAPTGIAAINVSGTTIHKLLRLSEGAYSYKEKRIRNIKSEILEAADVLILDEISMCRIDLFDCLYASIQKSNPDIQFVAVGDFCQLPPVLPNDEKEILSIIYKNKIETGYAFESKNWEKCGFKNIQLTQIMRQDNIEFIKNLNLARYGDKSCINYFNKHSAQKSTEGIYLTGTNKEVTEVNDKKLKQLPGKEKSLNAVTEGEDISRNVIADKSLNLKVGAKVMFLINTEDYANGDFGTVTKISNDVINVKVNGKEVAVSKYTWVYYVYDIVENKKIVFDETKYKEVTDKKIERRIAGTFEQFPLKLAYAITIHKSQGQTYDAVDLNPPCWDNGQLYCALSRVRDITKLWLKQKIKPGWLKADKKVKDFYKSLNDIISEPPKTELAGKVQGKTEPNGMITMEVPIELQESFQLLIKEFQKRGDG